VPVRVTQDGLGDPLGAGEIHKETLHIFSRHRVPIEVQGGVLFRESVENPVLLQRGQVQLLVLDDDLLLFRDPGNLGAAQDAE